VPISLVTIILLTTAFIWLERKRPYVHLKPVQGWYVRVFSMIAIEIVLVLGCRALIANFLDYESLFDLSDLNPIAGALIAYVLGTLIVYGWHRARHEFAWLWKVFHQLHHSPSRMEALTTFYRHPFEIAANAALGSAIVFGLLGLGTIEAAIYATMMISVQLFYHANIRTPRWLGYIIQRPEMHRIHHSEDYHRNNYGDLAIWDLLFGTWENPVNAENACGFSNSRELKIFDMFFCRDVHKDHQL
jgi:sterol desaturase/sphingolipid hydroxylase (fatty acid hydroxylase superfamily)